MLSPSSQSNRHVGRESDQRSEVTKRPGLLGSVVTPRAEGPLLWLGLTP